MKDYYAILKITPSATTDEIKKAFRRLALLYHPDKNKEASAHRHFTEIREAYETLKDPVKRASYNYKRHAAGHSNVQKPLVLHAADVLHASRELAKIVSRIDPFRVDLDAISFRIRDIVSPHNVSILLHANDEKLGLQTVQHVLSAARLLSFPLADDVIQPLYILKEHYPAVTNEISIFLADARWRYYWNNYKIAVALAIAIVFVLLIFLFGK